jgi:hypothetical protein
MRLSLAWKLLLGYAGGGRSISTNCAARQPVDGRELRLMMARPRYRLLPSDWRPTTGARS